MYILGQTIINVGWGDTISQTLKVYSDGIHLELKRNNDVIYDDVATNVIDSGDKITWKTPQGETKELIKYHRYTYA